MDKEFLAGYKELNKAQKAAVDIIDGPLLVVAGPGTGKTQLLSMRVANILQKTDTDPANILCLTFTDFAATNMRDRLNRLIGTPAHKVMVRTFHSFAAEIMNMYPDYFWNGASLRIVPDTVQLEIIQDILGQLPLDNPLAVKFAGAYTAINDAQQGLRLSKEAGLTPAKLAAMLAVNTAYIDIIEPTLVELLKPTLSIKKLESLASAVEKLPDQSIDENVTPLASLSSVLKTSLAQAIDSDLNEGKTTETGKWKRRWLQTVAGEKGMFTERRRNAWWQALVDVYSLYRDQLHGRGYYDYADMLIEVNTQLEQHSELLSQVQENFLYVLIDEFQDTNAAQLRLSHLVANHPSSEGKPNLMVVGDDDQSIFAFNGAELNNMLRFQDTYPTTQTIVLTDNYRSTQELLDFSRTIIEQADDRLVKRRPALNKNLRAVAAPSPGKLTHISYPTREHQLLGLAERVRQTWQDDPVASVAVLARSHDSLRQLSAYLTRLKVPIRYEQQNNVLDQPLMQQVALVAEIVLGIASGNESQTNYQLARLLAHPVWGIDDGALWQLAITNRVQAHWLDSLLKSADVRQVELAQWLLWLSRQATNEPLAAMLEYIIGLRDGPKFSSPLHNYFVSPRPVTSRYVQTLSAIQVVRSLVYEIVGQNVVETARLSDFVRFLHLSEQQSRPLTDESWFVSGSRAVQLMTVYKAKGLEFDSVFLVDAIEDNWQPRHIGRKPPANLPLQPYGELFDDYVRLAYVATTRAKRSVTVSSYTTNTLGRLLLPTPLIKALPTTTVDEKDAADAASVLEAALAWPRLETNDEKALLSPSLSEYNLNATAFLQFLDVTTGGPTHFLETQLLRLPQVTTSSMAYGTAVHRALQTAQQLTNAGKFKFASVVQSYEQALSEQQLPVSETERYRVHGEQVLANLFKLKTFNLVKGAKPEVAIREARAGAARLGGKLDRIDVNEDGILITDYKTGIPLPSFDSKDQTKAIKAWRHRNQLLFYTLLLRQSSRYPNPKNIRGQMMYVEAEDPASLVLTYEPDQESLSRIQSLITVVWKHIMDLNFPDTSVYPKTMAGINAFEADLLKGNLPTK